MIRLDEEEQVRRQYGNPFVADYTKNPNNIVPKGLSRKEKKAAAKEKAKEEKEKAKAESKASKAAAKEKAKEANAEAKEKTYYISINSKSPVIMKKRRSRIYTTNNVRPRQSVTLRKGFSLNGPLKERKNMSFIERKMAEMLKNEIHEEKNVISQKDLEQKVSVNLNSEEDYKGVAEEIKRMTVKTNPRPRPVLRARVKPETRPETRPRPVPRARVKPETKPETRPRPVPRARQNPENGRLTQKSKPVPRGRVVPRGTRKNV